MCQFENERMEEWKDLKMCQFENGRMKEWKNDFFRIPINQLTNQPINQSTKHQTRNAEHETFQTFQTWNESTNQRINQ